MEKIVSVAEMKSIEREADSKGLSYAQMMENAGSGLAEQINIAYSHVQERSAIALVGPGNNGGDALVALAVLASHGWKISAYLVKPRLNDDPLVERIKRQGGEVYSADKDVQYQNLLQLLGTHWLLIDGVLGTGIRLPLHGDVAACLEFVRNFIVENQRALKVVAVDCPSGVDCDSGQAAPEVIPADLTVTMAAVKRGLLSFPAAELTGDLRIVGIGDLNGLESWEKIACWMCDATYVKQNIPSRPRSAHKGTFGTALIVAGSINYTGAAFLAGQAAYRVGTGLVQMAVPSILHEVLAGQIPEAIWLPLSHEYGFIAADAAGLVMGNLAKITALLFGPGFGLQSTTQDFVRKLISNLESYPTLSSIVIDADGLKLLSEIPNWFRLLPSTSILTPHPGEMSILSGLTVEQIQADRIGIAREYAALWGHVVVLKGAFTVVASPHGEVVVIPVATPALARAGTGDVLAGLIVGLLAQKVRPFEAAVAGTWIHAMAGGKAEARLGAASVLAGDLLKTIPEVLVELNTLKLN